MTNEQLTAKLRTNFCITPHDVRHGAADRIEQQAAEIAMMRAEVEALRAALRTVAVVGYQMGVGTWCRVCHEWWLTAAPEAHKPDCLAAPKEKA